MLPGLKGNGKLTLGENIADHGGLNIAFQAFKEATAASPLPKKDGFTPEQRFFLAYARFGLTTSVRRKSATAPRMTRTRWAAGA